jgi:hypothetical protein
MDDQEKIKKIEEISKKYKAKINELKLEQDKIISEYIKELEKAKMEELRNEIIN